MSYLFSIIGIVLIVEGLPYFAFPSKVKKIAQQLPDIPDSVLRGIGFFLMLTGLFIAYVANRT